MSVIHTGWGRSAGIDQSVEFDLMGQLAVCKRHPTRIVEGVLVGSGCIEEAMSTLGCRVQFQLSG